MKEGKTSSTPVVQQFFFAAFHESFFLFLFFHSLCSLSLSRSASHDVCVSLLPSDDASLFICSAFLFPALFLLFLSLWQWMAPMDTNYQWIPVMQWRATQATQLHLQLKILNGRPFHSLPALVFACHSRKTKERTKVPNFPLCIALFLFLLSFSLFHLSLRVSFFYMCISLPSTSSGLDTHTHTYSLTHSQTLFFSLSILFIALYLLVFRFFSVFFPLSLPFSPLPLPLLYLCLSNLSNPHDRRCELNGKANAEKRDRECTMFDGCEILNEFPLSLSLSRSLLLSLLFLPSLPFSCS